MGFEVISISRLKNTFGSLPKKTIAALEYHKSIIDPSSKSKNLRTIVAEKPDNLPYVATTFSDYASWDEIFQDFINEE